MTYLFIARFKFLARGALIGAQRSSCSSAKRRAAFTTSLADSDPGHREARASRVRQHDKLLRGPVRVERGRGHERNVGLRHRDRRSVNGRRLNIQKKLNFFSVLCDS